MRFSHRFLTGAVVLSILGTLCFHPITAEARRMTAAEQAAAEAAEAERQAVYNKAVDSNSIEGWPQGPQIYAESAIVMEADTGTILYNKDMDMVNYPASITKIMTALVTLDHCALDEVVTYSYYATHSIEAGSSTIGTTEGEELTVEESLYALMLESANECGNGLAEHVAGSIDAFVELMNQNHHLFNAAYFERTLIYDLLEIVISNGLKFPVMQRSPSLKSEPLGFHCIVIMLHALVFLIHIGIPFFIYFPECFAPFCCLRISKTAVVGQDFSRNGFKAASVLYIQR